MHYILKQTILLIFALVSFAGILSANSTNDSTKAKVRILNDKKVVLKEVKQLPKVIKEASGLENSSGNFLWTHNDDGIPALYCLDSAGNLVRAVQLNASNRGWEDLTQDEKGNFFIGGFGNNTNDKKDLKIYKIPPPETITELVTTPEIIRYNYSYQTSFPPPKARKNFDVDAFFAWKDFLYLFTKDRSVPFTGYSKIYRLNQHDLKQTAVLIDSIFVGQGPMINNWVTSVDISPDKKTVALLLHDRILFIKGFSEKKFSSGKMYQLNLNHYSHKAGMCFITNERIQIVDEFEMGLLGGKLYSLDIQPLLSELKP
jgi:hypothetical protein